MTREAIVRPGAGEFAPFYQGYIDRSAGADVLEQLEAQRGRVARLAARLDAGQWGHRYAPGKWSVQELLGHLLDAERVFSYRAFRIARGDATPLAGFDENFYVAQSGFERRRPADLAAEFDALRRANILLFSALTPEELARTGSANNAVVSARALAWILAGHMEHHLGVLREKYGVAAD